MVYEAILTKRQLEYKGVSDEPEAIAGRSLPRGKKIAASRISSPRELASYQKDSQADVSHLVPV
jgi:hypothetical protein